MSGLIENAHYSEAEKILRRMADGGTGVDERGHEGLSRLAELCTRAMRAHAEVRWHCESAATGAAAESRLRSEVIALAERVLGGGADGTVEPGDPVPVRREPALQQSVDRSDLVVHCLGPLRVYVDERDLGPPPNRRARSVFKYLVLHRSRATPKEVLMGLFWPEATPGAARNNLNVAIHALRRYLRTDDRDGHVVFRADGYQLNPDMTVWVDVEQFTGHVDRARSLRIARDAEGELAELEAAEVLYQGSLFEDESCEEWATDHEREVQDGYVDVLDRLGRRYRAAGDHGALARVLRKVLAVQPAHEAAHRELMRCYAGVGQRHLALRQYDDCRTALAAHLDLEPSPETTVLFEKIRQIRVAVPSA